MTPATFATGIFPAGDFGVFLAGGHVQVAEDQEFLDFVVGDLRGGSFGQSVGNREIATMVAVGKIG